MFVRRSAIRLARQTPSRIPIATRQFSSSVARRDSKPTGPAPGSSTPAIKKLSEIKTADDLFGPGAEPGTIPTDLEQATGLERLEILGKMEGVDVFDMKPLDSSRKGTMKDPIVVQSFGEEHYIGCTGVPADTHHQLWMVVSRERPIERCSECGNVIKMEYVGPQEDPHAHDHGHGHDEHAWAGEPKTFADFVKPDYR